MIELHPEFVSLQELLEDAEDILDIQQAKRESAGQPRTSLEELMKRFGMSANE